MSASTITTKRLLRQIQSSTSQKQSSSTPFSIHNRHVTRHLQPNLQTRRNASTKRTHPPPPPPASPIPHPQNHAGPGPIQPMQPGNDPASKTRGKFAPILLSFFAVGLGFYITQLVIVARQPCKHPEIQNLSLQKDVAARYDETADGFDSEVGSSEALMGINGIRKRLSKMCKGHVLEVSCGTGRNLGYYPLHPGSEIDSLTFLDLSPQMIAVCKKKWLALYPSTTTQKFKKDLAIRFSTSSALEPMPPAPTTTKRSTERSEDPSAGKYTTILQTMGLCSVPDPSLLLRNLAAHLDTSDPSARILLLEHGRSSYAWLNNILDNAAQKHAEIHGCWFNRDIGSMVEEACKESGLEIVSERRKHLGTTWVFELRASEKTVAAARAGGGVKAGDSVVVEDVKAEEKGWRGWLGLK